MKSRRALRLRKLLELVFDGQPEADERLQVSIANHRAELAKTRQMLTLPQGQVRVVKAFPIFHGWSFSTGVEFDDKIIDPDSLKRCTTDYIKFAWSGWYPASCVGGTIAVPW